MTGGQTAARRAGGLLAAAVLAALGLTGCQAIASSLMPPPTVTPSTLAMAPPSTETPSPNASPSTTRPPTAVPAAAKAKTKAGSASFVGFFWQQFNRSQTEPNPSVLTPLIQDSCKPCSGYVDAAQALQGGRQRYADPPFVVKGIKSNTLTGNTATVLTDISQQGASVVDQSSKTLGSATQREFQFLVTLTWVNNGWKVSDIQTAS